jgi:hypothetical protein
MYILCAFSMKLCGPNKLSRRRGKEKNLFPHRESNTSWVEVCRALRGQSAVEFKFERAPLRLGNRSLSFHTVIMTEETVLHYNEKPYITICTCCFENIAEFQRIAAKKICSIFSPLSCPTTTDIPLSKHQ